MCYCIDVMECRLTNRVCNYLLLNETEFRAVTPPIALIFTASLHFLVHFNFSTFCEVFLKLRIFHRPYDNFEKKKQFYLADPIIFRCETGNCGSIWSV